MSSEEASVDRPQRTSVIEHNVFGTSHATKEAEEAEGRVLGTTLEPFMILFDVSTAAALHARDRVAMACEQFCRRQV